MKKHKFWKSPITAENCGGDFYNTLVYIYCCNIHPQPCLGFKLIFWYTRQAYYTAHCSYLILQISPNVTKGLPHSEKVTKLWILSVVPLAPPPPPRHLRTLRGDFFPKGCTDNSRQLEEKARRLPFSREPIIFIKNSSILVLSNHVWEESSDFVLFSSYKNSFSDIRKNTPKYYMEYGIWKISIALRLFRCNGLPKSDFTIDFSGQHSPLKSKTWLVVAPVIPKDQIV